MELIDIINGLTTSIFILFSVITGLRLISKYFVYKRNEFLGFGFAWIGFIVQYYPVVLSFWGSLIFGVGLSLTTYLFIASFIPFSIVMGIFGWSELVYKDNQKYVVGLTILLSIVVFCVFIYSTFFNPSVLAYLDGISLRYGVLTLGFLFILTVMGIYVGYFFYRETKDAKEIDIHLKGMLIAIGLIMFLFGELLDALLPYDIISICFSRSVLILGSFMYYFGFFPPKRLLEYVNNKNNEM